ncbi:MAG: 2-amino-4-hydroxy-6-hydroxymethyldihydropteridine diphosphokinase [Xanthobacteraceae bacterium]
MAEALVGLGGNIGDVRATLNEAMRQFADGREVKLVARSSDYRTPPWGVTDQPPFINCAIAVATALPPRALLDRAFAVERALGRDRTREQRWGPRAIDIDLLAYDDLVLNEPDLTLPHPRLFERAFVLVPLAEIGPDRMIAGRRVRDAAERLDKSGIERLPASR